MQSIYIYAIIAILAYIIQILLGIRQIKEFSKNYKLLRQIGPVAIGRHTSKFRAGTIVMLALDDTYQIIGARKMQGVTVFAKFKEMPTLIGTNIRDIKPDSHEIQQELSITRKAILDAYETFCKVKNGEVIEVKKPPIQRFFSKIMGRNKPKRTPTI